MYVALYAYKDGKPNGAAIHEIWHTVKYSRGRSVRRRYSAYVNARGELRDCELTTNRLDPQPVSRSAHRIRADLARIALAAYKAEISRTAAG